MNKKDRDNLTGLYNFRGIESKVHSTFIECVEKFDISDKSGGHYAIVMFDVDYFKSVNDLFGHEQGNAVLQGIGDLLRDYEQTRRDFIGLFGRYGGEEFLLALPYHTSKQAKYIADEIRDIVQRYAFYDVNKRTFSLKEFITVSMGISSVNMPLAPGDCSENSANENKLKETVKRLKIEADCALDYAKFLGRNRVEIFENHLISELKNLNIIRNFFFRYSHKKPSEIRTLLDNKFFTENQHIAKQILKYFQIIRRDIHPKDTRTQAVFADNMYRQLSGKDKQEMFKTLDKLVE